MKPIEKGCLAMVVRSYFPENIGRVSVVGGRFITSLDYRCDLCGGNNEWKMPDLPPLGDGRRWTACTCCLIRIDTDPDAVAVDERVEQTA
jgi:hypothetical protein